VTQLLRSIQISRTLDKLTPRSQPLGDLPSSEIGMDTIVKWFKHKPHGEARKNVIKTVTFIAKPSGSMSEAAWIEAFE